MNNRLKPVTLILTCILSTCAHAQTPTPVPAEFATAHTLFLAPAGIASITNGEDYVSEMYSQTYQMLASIGPYQLTTKPTAADLAAEISVNVTPGASPQLWATLRLSLYDAKTRILLWTLDAPLGESLADKDVAKNISTAEARLATDLKALIGGTLPISPATLKKTRITQEKQ